MTKRYSLPEDVCNAVLEYLGTQPFNDTANLIGAIRENAELVDTPTGALEALQEIAALENDDTVSATEAWESALEIATRTLTGDED